MISPPTALPGYGRAAPAGAGNIMPAARAEELGFAGMAERLRSGRGAGLPAVTAGETEPPAGVLPESEATPTLDAEAMVAAEPLPQDEQDSRLHAAMTDAGDTRAGDINALAGEAETDRGGVSETQEDAGSRVGSEAGARTWALSLPAHNETETPPNHHRPGVEAPVQLWRLRERALAAEAAPAHVLPNVAVCQGSRQPGPDALLPAQSGSPDASASKPVPGAGQLFTEAPSLFVSVLTAGRSAPAGTHEWAAVQVQSGDKAVLGEQLLQTLKDKVELQLNQRVQQAHIRLDPPEMGRMELTVRLEGDRLHVQINASHNGLREAIQAQADRLRQDLLAQHGGGVEVHVGRDGRQDRPSQFNENIQIGAASAEPGEDTTVGPMRLGWVNALA